MVLETRQTIVLAKLKEQNQLNALQKSALNISAISGARGGLGDAKVVNINMEAAQKVTINGADSAGVSKYKSASDQVIEQIIREINNLTGGNNSVSM